MSGNVHAVTRVDAHVAVWRAFTGQPAEDDANLFRAIAALVEGMLRTKEAALARPGDSGRRVVSNHIPDPGAAPLR